MEAPAHGFIYVEFRSDKAGVETAQRFYKKVFDWQFDTLVKGDFPNVAFDADDGIGGGLTVPELESGPAWIPYVRVYDVHESAAKAAANGGHIIYQPFTIPYKGALCILKDPAGAVIGLWQPYAP